MLTHRLLVPAVFGLGILLLVIGLVTIVAGVPIVRMEIGWTEVVGGAVAASAGCVILAMGVLASQLDAIRLSLAYMPADEARDEPVPMVVAEPAFDAPGPLDAAQGDFFADEASSGRPEPVPEPPSRRLVHPLAPQAWPATPAPDQVRPEPALATLPARDEDTPLPPVAPALDEGAPALIHHEEEESHSPAVIAPDPVLDAVADLPAPPVPVSARTKPNFLSSFLAKRGIAPAPDAGPSERNPFEADLGGPPAHPVRTAVDLSSGWDDEPPAEASRVEPPPAADAEVVDQAPDLDEPLAEEASPPAPTPMTPAEPDPLQPVVVGRYNAGSASYVMYSNGMIEVETEQGTHQFGSMQELKNFIEKRDARVS